MNINQITKDTNNNISESVEVTVKNLIREDSLEVLLSMINNGFDVNSFQYKGFRGVNAIIAFRLDCNIKELGEIIEHFVIEHNSSYEIHPENEKRIAVLIEKEARRAIREDIRKAIEKDVKENTEEDIQEITEEDIKEAVEGFVNFLSDMTRGVLGKYDDIEDDTIEDETLEEDVDSSNSQTDQKALLEEQNLCSNIENEDTIKEEGDFTIIGDSDYRVSNITSYVTLENISTCDIEKISINTHSVEELNNKINEKIEELNKKNDEKFLNSIVDMMNTDDEFKTNLFRILGEAQKRRH